MPNAGDIGRQELGRHLRRARHALGWTLDSLADRLGNEGVSLDPSTLSRIEKGQLPIDLNVASALSRCLGTSVSALDEILRSARRRKTIDLTGWDFDGLIAAGKEEVSKGDIYGALDYFEAARDSLALRTPTDDVADNLARALVLEGLAHLRLRNYVLAHELNGRALNLVGTSADSQLFALLAQVLIGYYSGDLRRANAFAREAEPLLTSGSDATRAFGFAVLGDLSFVQDDFAGAVPWLEKARDANRSLGNEREQHRAQITLGNCLYRLGHTENGLRIASEALRAAERCGFPEVATLGYRTVGRLLLDQKDFERARPYFKKAQEGARRLGLASDEFLAYFFLWECARGSGTSAECKRCERAMKNLVPHIDQNRAEVQKFLSTAAEQVGKGEKRK